MADLVTHLPITLKPDSKRTVVRPFFAEDPTAFAVKDHSRAERIVERVLGLGDQAMRAELRAATARLAARHRDVEPSFQRRFNELEGLTIDRARVGREQALLIGAYFTQEFSFESAALFNPSVVRHPDQSEVTPGATKLLFTLRGIGEGHVSSLIFRTGIWEADGALIIDPPSEFAVAPLIDEATDEAGHRVVHLNCGGSREISETVIFPFLPSQGKGIEDARLVEFTEEDGKVDWRGTFTAFDGSEARQAMLWTADFKTFDMRAVEGPLAHAKGAALFPRRIGGRYWTLGRQDNENLWLLSSTDFHDWEDARKILTPRYPWECIQIGNCGSPIELDEGWLVLTHGVGTVRNYSLGACLLDKDDPAKVLARLSEPLLEPSDMERDGYVPNVVYSCGALLRNRTLLLPYGVADSYTAFGIVEIDALLAAMR